jgi:hypothetical protein
MSSNNKVLLPKAMPRRPATSGVTKHSSSNFVTAASAKSMKKSLPSHNFQGKVNRNGPGGGAESVKAIHNNTTASAKYDSVSSATAHIKGNGGIGAGYHSTKISAAATPIQRQPYKPAASTTSNR